MASAHGHLNNEVMNNNRPPAPKFRKWLMRNNKSSLSGLTFERSIFRKIGKMSRYKRGVAGPKKWRPELIIPKIAV